MSLIDLICPLRLDFLKTWKLISTMTHSRLSQMTTAERRVVAYPHGVEGMGPVPPLHILPMEATPPLTATPPIQ